MLTEEEAKTKCCHRHAASVGHPTAMCAASACMAWLWNQREFSRPTERVGAPSWSKYDGDFISAELDFGKIARAALQHPASGERK